MNKPIRILLFVIGMPIFTYLFLAQFGVLKLYNNPSTANEPTLKLDSKMLVLNLVKPKLGDFVCFRFNGEEWNLGTYIQVNRLCAIENDTLEIKKGVVYLNNSNFDEKLSLMHSYKVSLKTFEMLKKEGLVDENNSFGRTNGDFFIIYLKDGLAKKYDLLDDRIIEEKTNKSILKMFNNNWNRDNFGPIIIPENKIFVLGDNRDNAMDSRYVGLIDINKIVGVVVKKL